MRRLHWAAAWTVIAASLATARGQTTIFAENFDEFEYGPNLQEGRMEVDVQSAVWTKTGPEGWTIDDSQMPAGGVTEWAGWSFVDDAWWTDVADDEGRGQFFSALGTVAVADPDEWSDAPHDPGLFNSFLSTPAIDVAAAGGTTAELSFFSAWQPSGTQTATVAAIFDGGDPVELVRWGSDENGADYWPAALDDFVFLNVDVPDGASEMTLQWGLTDAADDWYWAVDNINLLGDGVGFFEDFETVSLGPNVFEHAVDGLQEGVFLADAPAGWTKTNGSEMPGVGDDEVGVLEFEGWNFMNYDWWTGVSGGEGREGFTQAAGGVLVADPDQWNDLGDPAASGTFDSLMETPIISLDGVDAETVQVAFDSSWRPSGDQQAVVEAIFDGGDPVELLRFTSDDADEHFHADALGEAIALDVLNPEGAAEMVLRFGLSDAGDDRWWAIDNLIVTAGGGEEPWPGDADGDRDVDLADFNVLKANFNTSGEDVGRADGDFTGDMKVDLADFNILKANFNTSAPVPEPSAWALAAAAGIVLGAGRRRRR